MAVWPATLPAPMINSLSTAPANNALVTGMDKGPKKTRRRTTANTKPIAFTLALTSAQVDILESFFNNDTFSGTIPFTFTHPRTGETVSASFEGQPPTSGEQEGLIFPTAVSLVIYP